MLSPVSTSTGVSPSRTVAAIEWAGSEAGITGTTGEIVAGMRVATLAASLLEVIGESDGRTTDIGATIDCDELLAPALANADSSLSSSLTKSSSSFV